jgi:hypothetical protein
MIRCYKYLCEHWTDLFGPLLGLPSQLRKAQKIVSLCLHLSKFELGCWA